MAYIKGIDRTRYGVLAAELKNRYAKGQNDYPTDLAMAFALVNLYETPKNEQVQQHNGSHKANHHGRVKMHSRICYKPTRYIIVQSLWMTLAARLKFMDLISRN